MIEFSVEQRRGSKTIIKIVWKHFMSGEIHASPSGYTASIIAAEAQKKGIGFQLRYYPEFKAYTIQRLYGPPRPG